ncbi:superoxide dismutase [Caulobacter segnis]|uniref:Superoxide dismutase n=1 Tax=Caulobacter segnis TaxID=88688 RepID=A0A2W5VHJ6_9CAUL|nr:superoxide dismutase [Caulobacter segnis]PZR36166.1 MAG: superoxide dismutase [Caulobacter segnis]
MRRSLLALTILAFSISTPALAQTTASAPTGAQQQAAFTLAPLPYAYEALSPVIDVETMRIHHGRHHQAYVNALNTAVAATPALQGKSLEAILAEVSRHPAVVRNNAGGHYNHTLFWTLMAAPGQGGAPSAKLLAQIDKDFGSLDAFKKAFETAGLQRFGSGWAWLIWSEGKLRVVSTPNQDNPLMDDAPVKGAPILANDVWEHAYYLQYQNNRGAYLSGWWQVVNWNKANALFDAAAR